MLQNLSFVRNWTGQAPAIILLYSVKNNMAAYCIPNIRNASQPLPDYLLLYVALWVALLDF